MRVHKRKGGRTYYCYVYEGGVRRQKSTRCHDKAAAEIVARQLERDAADPDHAAAREATLTQALQLLYNARAEEARAGRKSTATVAFYRSKGGHLVRILEHDKAGEYRPFRIIQLTPVVVDKYISARRGEDASDHTISKELVTLRLALRFAKRAGLWRGDLAEVLPVAFAPAYEPRTRHLPVPEVKRLLGQLQADQAARAAFILATSACWAESERAERLDVGADLSAVEIRGTKRKARKRVVPLVTEWQRSLMRHALAHAEGVGARLFRPWANVRHDLEAAARRAKIDRFSPNDLRRSFAHWMRNAGVPLELLAPLMGHGSTKMLQEVYGRLDPGELESRLKAALSPRPALAQLLAPVLGVLAQKGVERLGPEQLAELLKACITGASTGGAPGELHELGELPAARKTSGNPENLVPRDGIEPPTRGFSIPRDLWPKPRETRGNAGSFVRGARRVARPASLVHQGRPIDGRRRRC